MWGQNRSLSWSRAPHVRSAVTCSGRCVPSWGAVGSRRQVRRPALRQEAGLRGHGQRRRRPGPALSLPRGAPCSSRPGRAPQEETHPDLEGSSFIPVAQLVKTPPAMRETWVQKIPWRRERLPTLVFRPGEFHGLYSPQGRTESDATERLSLSSLESSSWEGGRGPAGM